MIPTLILLCVIILINNAVLGVNVLVLSVMLLIVAYKYKRNARLDNPIYVVSLALTVATLFVDIKFISSGLVGFSMFNVVMFTGVIPNKWALTRVLKSYRDMYSILGVIFILPHVYLNLFVDQQINLIGVAAFVIMLPLFITSFSIIRKEMNNGEWIKLQKAAYLVYVLLFAHLISVADWYGKILYAVMMTLYINNKLMKEFRK